MCTTIHFLAKERSGRQSLTAHHPSSCRSLTNPAQNFSGLICDAVSGDTPILDLVKIISTTTICSSLGKSEFHAEWLRDEPCDATATGPASYIPADRCQLSPGNGDHEIRVREIASHFPEPLFQSGQRDFVFIGKISRLIPRRRNEIAG